MAMECGTEKAVEEQLVPFLYPRKGARNAATFVTLSASPITVSSFLTVSHAPWMTVRFGSAFASWLRDSDVGVGTVTRHAALLLVRSDH